MRKEKPLSIVVLISGKGSNLQAIIDAIAAKKLSVRIAAVISNRAAAGGLARAKAAGIPTAVLSDETFADRRAYDAALQQLIESYRPDYLILAGFMRILSADFVSAFAYRILNIHPSLLPRHPGLRTHEKVIAAGEQIHGCTIHIVTPVLDAGPIIAQAQLPIHPGESVINLQHRVHQLEHQLYPLVLSWLAKGLLSIQKNNLLFEGNNIPAAGIQFSEKTLVNTYENLSA